MGMKHARKRNTLVDKLVVRYLYNILWHIVYPYVLWVSVVTKEHTREQGHAKSKCGKFYVFWHWFVVFPFGIWFFLCALSQCVLFWFLMSLYCVILCVSVLLILSARIPM